MSSEQTDRQQMSDEDWSAIRRLLATSSSQPKIQSPLLSRDEIIKWHVMHGQAQTCTQAVAGNHEAAKHVHACPDCQAHFTASRGCSFSDFFG